MAGKVHVVHCIDTEGPLHESVSATFARLRVMFGLDLTPSTTLLRQLQAGAVDLGGLEAEVQKVVDPHLLAYNDTWDKVDEMLADCMSAQFRDQLLDSDDKGWLYNWFLVDHVDYDQNPRRRDLGYHNVFDHYQQATSQSGQQDGLHFHYHPHNFTRDAHRCATHWWANSDSLQQAISRRVIDRHWFPAANRPGFHTERPDSHWFLEQYIPFDYANQSDTDPNAGSQSAASGGRWGDWRRAPTTWAPYHPSHDDYQVPGQCRRWIARCLNVGTRFRLLSEQDVRQAFDEARDGNPVVLSFTNHDHRDMRPDIQGVRDLLRAVTPDYPEVPFYFSEAVTAMRDSLQLPSEPACELDVTLSTSDSGAHVLQVGSTTATFGPQPWLALKTRAGSYFHDNFDIDEPRHRWSYVFDEDTFPLSALESIGVAANNSYGTTTVRVIDAATGDVTTEHWNR